MAQLSETAAMMSWDSGHQALAQRYYVLALRASRAAGDRAFGANVMAALARQLLYLGHSGDALELVRLAQDDSAGYATASVRSMLYTREAWAYAQLGRMSAFRRATGRAEDALAEAQPAEDPYWITYFDVAELEGTTGGRLLDLAHHDERLADETAERISQAVALRRPGHVRSSALDQIGLAEARLVQGEMEEASRLGQQAAALVEQTPSDRVRVKLAELYQHSNGHAHIPRDRQPARLYSAAVRRTARLTTEETMPRIAITGHMNLTADSVPLVYKAVTDALAPYAGDELTGISCIARGADSVFAQAVLDVGGKLEVVLPAAGYRAQKVKPDHAPQFDELLRRATTVRVMPFTEANRVAYEATNEVLVSICDALFARMGRAERGGQGRYRVSSGICALARRAGRSHLARGGGKGLVCLVGAP